MRVIVVCILICVLYQLYQWAFRKWWDKGLKIQVSCDHEYAYEGDNLHLVETIENRKILPIPALKVKFTTSKFWMFEGVEHGTITDKFYRNDVFAVGGNERVIRKLPFVCKRRGYFFLGDVDVFGGDYFFSKEFMKRFSNKQWVYIFAKRVSCPKLDFFYKQMMGDMISKKRLFEDPFTFAGIRDYESYDTMRRINWKASAKTGELKVNTYAFTAEQNVNLVLFFEQKNVEWDKNMEEYAISLVATIGEYFIRDRVNVSFYSNGLDAENGNSMSLLEGSGQHHLRRLDECLARIDLLYRDNEMEHEEVFLERALKMDEINLVVTTCQTALLQEKLLQKVEEGYQIRWLLPHYEMDIPKVDERLKEYLLELVSELG
ncbi:MAG: DUF58 domain-containing protein [Lachnospiraceae bacterium]|nr:DUF58 domain-containing protein [Lachnospiraceae bacterium]